MEIGQTIQQKHPLLQNLLAVDHRHSHSIHQMGKQKETQEQMEQLWHFLGAGEITDKVRAALNDELNLNPDAEWQRKKAGEIAQVLQKGKRGSWREMFTSNDRRVFQEIAGETLGSWDYEV